MSVVAYTDLFAAGLGFDITGACLLAQGLLTRADEFAHQFTQSQNSLAWANVRAATDHADGQAGVIALCVGFLLQAAGYVLAIGGVSAHTDGTWAAVIALVFTGRGRWDMARCSHNSVASDSLVSGRACSLRSLGEPARRPRRPGAHALRRDPQAPPGSREALRRRDAALSTRVASGARQKFDLA
jgi:hypothetical protein